MFTYRCVAAEETRTGNSDPFLECVQSLTSEAHFSGIASKLPLRDFTNISFSMLADQSKPTAVEQREIAEWFDRRDACQKSSEEYHQSHWPPELVQLADEGATGFKAIGVDLYNRKITFGEANKQIQLLGDSIKAKTIPIVARYQADAAAQKAAAGRQAQAANQRAFQEQANADARYAQQQALKQQRTQMLLNYLQVQQQAQAQQLRDQVAPRPSYTTNCFTAGSNTNCTTH